jgi:hypothetical protein
MPGPMQPMPISMEQRRARAARFGGAQKRLEIPVPKVRTAFMDAGPTGKWVISNRDEALRSMLVRTTTPPPPPPPSPATPQMFGCLEIAALDMS